MDEIFKNVAQSYEELVEGNEEAEKKLERRGTGENNDELWTMMSIEVDFQCWLIKEIQMKMTNFLLKKLVT